jgi:small nuclear ribonucleoprotein (snRNP)-like protein
MSSKRKKKKSKNKRNRANNPKVDFGHAVDDDQKHTNVDSQHAAPGPTAPPKIVIGEPRFHSDVTQKRFQHPQHDVPFVGTNQPAKEMEFQVPADTTMTTDVDAHRAQVRKMCNCTTRVTISDGRVVVGRLECVDNHCNLLLRDAFHVDSVSKGGSSCCRAVVLSWCVCLCAPAFSLALGHVL